MKRLFVILLIICTFNIFVNGQERLISRFDFGIEWGYMATFYTGYRYIFFPPEGYRVDIRNSSVKLRSNAEVYAHAGYNLNERWNLSLYAGYAGVSDFHKIIPVSLRGTRYFGNDPRGDRWIAYLDLGSGICLKTPVQEILNGKIGGGYRLALSKDTKLDLLMAARFTYTHPQITYDKLVISHDMIRRNNAYAAAVSIGLGLTF